MPEFKEGDVLIEIGGSLMCEITDICPREYCCRWLTTPLRGLSYLERFTMIDSNFVKVGVWNKERGEIEDE